jgi:hypothetical protein
MTLDVCIAKRLPCHVWFHPWNWSIHSGSGKTRESTRRDIHKFFFPLLEHAKRKEKSGVLSLETMLSAAQKMEEINE